MSVIQPLLSACTGIIVILNFVIVIIIIITWNEFYRWFYNSLSVYTFSVIRSALEYFKSVRAHADKDTHIFPLCYSSFIVRDDLPYIHIYKCMLKHHSCVQLLFVCFVFKIINSTEDETATATTTIKNCVSLNNHFQWNCASASISGIHTHTNVSCVAKW